MILGKSSRKASCQSFLQEYHQVSSTPPPPEREGSEGSEGSVALEPGLERVWTPPLVEVGPVTTGGVSDDGGLALVLGHPQAPGPLCYGDPLVLVGITVLGDSLPTQLQ